MLLQIQERQIEPGTTVVELIGKLALGRESQRVETLVDELTAKSVHKVILDMTGVDYIDSAGIGLLALGAGKMKSAGGMLVVVTAPGRVLDMLKLTQVSSVVKVCGTIEEATAALDSNAASA